MTMFESKAAGLAGSDGTDPYLGFLFRCYSSAKDEGRVVMLSSEGQQFPKTPTP
jgi:hypothetical protein